MKVMVSIMAGLMLALLFALPASAQTEQSVTVTFQLTVQGPPCPNATYWVYIGPPGSEFSIFQMADPEGDGVYTYSQSVPAGAPWVIQLVQGTGSRIETGGPLLCDREVIMPGEPSRIITRFETGEMLFGAPVIRFYQDTVLEAQVTGCPARLPDTGARDQLPMAPFAGAVLLLTSGAYLRQRMRHGT